MRYKILPYSVYDKRIEIDCNGISVWVDFDDVNPKDARRVARQISRIPKLLEYEKKLKELTSVV